MKKIVFVLEQLYGGGAERVTNVLANEICNKPDYQVHLLTYRQDAQRDFAHDERVIRHNMGQSAEGESRIKGIQKRIRFLRDTIREINPDCVVSLAMPRTVVLLVIAMLGSKIPLILSERNDPVRFPTSKYVRALRLWCYKKCNGVVFQTNEAKSFFPAAIQKKGIVICNPLTGNLPPRWDGEREKRIVNFCRLDPQKNLDLLIDAFSDVLRVYPDYTLWIYGDGNERTRLEQKVCSMGIAEKVRMPGYSNQIYQDIRKAAMFVSSSDYEGISNSMLESMALGVPTICTDCPAGGARETICHGENGLLVPTGNRAELAEAMKRLLAEPELSEALSREGSCLREKISAQAIAGQWLEFIEKTVG